MTRQRAPLAGERPKRKRKRPSPQAFKADAFQQPELEFDRGEWQPLLEPEASLLKQYLVEMASRTLSVRKRK
ncbi:MAG TPA: hypothetical protein VF678_00180 [bacterium]